MSVLIGIPLLLIASLILFTLFNKKKKLLIISITILWTLPIIAFVLGIILEKLRSPMDMTKDDIVGDYRIDKSFYPGKNSDWQYDHYKFSVTTTDSMLFYITVNDTLVKCIGAKIVYSATTPRLWKIEDDSLHHVIEYQPTLFRSHKRFYYVFKSDRYGNMFFRKEFE